MKLCYGPDTDAAIATAHRLWPNGALPGQLPQDLRTPAQFRDASTLVTKEMIASAVTCGPDLHSHTKAIREYVSAGFDDVLIHQIGSQQREFFRFAADSLLPALRDGNRAVRPQS